MIQRYRGILIPCKRDKNGMLVGELLVTTPDSPILASGDGAADALAAPELDRPTVSAVLESHFSAIRPPCLKRMKTAQLDELEAYPAPHGASLEVERLCTTNRPTKLFRGATLVRTFPMQRTHTLYSKKKGPRSGPNIDTKWFGVTCTSYIK